MPQQSPSDAEVLSALRKAGSQRGAAKLLGISESGLRGRLLRHRLTAPDPEPLEFPALPDPNRTAEEVLRARELEFTRRDLAHRARLLIPVKVKLDGPVGIVHMGDPHLDDPGTDILAVQRHVRTIQSTEGLFGANVGDLHNNWVGRHARLYAEQETSKQDAWTLVEWLISQVEWLYLIYGNHDMWTESEVPLLQWMMKDRRGVREAWGARLNLQFPNGRQIRVNARHDFHGHSQWNTAHGPGKAIQMGWRDHLLTCGHKHTSGIQVLKCPSTGLISTALRVASYKVIDRYADELGLPNQNISPAVVTIIDPKYEDDDPRLIHTIWDVEEAAEWLTWKRSRKTR